MFPFAVSRIVPTTGKHARNSSNAWKSAAARALVIVSSLLLADPPATPAEEAGRALHLADNAAGELGIETFCRHAGAAAAAAIRAEIAVAAGMARQRLDICADAAAEAFDEDAMSAAIVNRLGSAAGEPALRTTLDWLYGDAGRAFAAAYRAAVTGGGAGGGGGLHLHLDARADLVAAAAVRSRLRLLHAAREIAAADSVYAAPAYPSDAAAENAAAAGIEAASYARAFASLSSDHASDAARFVTSSPAREVFAALAEAVAAELDATTSRAAGEMARRTGSHRSSAPARY